MSASLLPANRQSAGLQKGKPPILFVHHFGGDRVSLSRHIRLAHDLGHDVIWVELSHMRKRVDFPAITSQGDFGFGFAWKEQIVRACLAYPGPKILWSFSMPSNSALVALKERDDIVAWICDSGPFLELRQCIRNLFRLQYKMNPLRATAAAAGATLLYGPRFPPVLRDAAHSHDVNRPILSFRGGRDPLVPERAIEKVFALMPATKIERVLFPEAGHLDGLKRFPEEYRSHVAKFLDDL